MFFFYTGGSYINRTDERAEIEIEIATVNRTKLELQIKAQIATSEEETSLAHEVSIPKLLQIHKLNFG